MKIWMGVVIVVAALALGLWLMAPKTPPPVPLESASAAAAAGEEKIQFISRGEAVEISAHLKDGRYTVVNFTADW